MSDTTELGTGTIGLIIGIVGLFIFSVILSPIAIIMGIIGLFRFQIFLGPLAILFGILGVGNPNIEGEYKDKYGKIDEHYNG